MKYLQTSEVLIIPTSRKIFQIKVDDPMFDKIKTILESNPDANLSDLGLEYKTLNYEDDEISLTQEENSDKAEIYYNGKYFDLSGELITTFLSLLHKNDGFKLEYGIKFLKRLLKNPYFNYVQLYEKLREISFDFTYDGQVIVNKEYEEEVAGLHLKRRKIGTKSLKQTFILIKPEDINADFEITEYVVIDSRIFINEFPFLTRTYIGDWRKLVDAYNKFHKEGTKDKEHDTDCVKMMEDSLREYKVLELFD